MLSAEQTRHNSQLMHASDDWPYARTYQIITDPEFADALDALYADDVQFGHLVRARDFAPQSLIAGADDLNSNLYIVIEGTVNLVSMDSHGRRLVVSRLGPGAIFGDGAILQHLATNIHAEAEQAAQVWVVASTQARNAALHYPILSWALLRTASERLGQVVVNMESVAYRRLPERLADLLLELSEADPAQSDDRGEPGQRIIRGVSHQNLADTLGTYRESVSALLRNLKHEAVVEIGYRWIRILDVAALAELAGAGY